MALVVVRGWHFRSVEGTTAVDVDVINTNAYRECKSTLVNDVQYDVVAKEAAALWFYSAVVSACSSPGKDCSRKQYAALGVWIWDIYSVEWVLRKLPLQTKRTGTLYVADTGFYEVIEQKGKYVPL